MESDRDIDLDVRPEYPGLARIGAVLRRWWPAIVLGAVVFGALGAKASKPATTPYSASAQILVGPLAGELSVLRAAGQQAQTYADLASSRPVYLATLKRLKLADTTGQFGRRVQVDANSETRLLRVTVRAQNPADAAREANALAAEVVRQSASAQPVVTASSTSPKTTLNPREAAAQVRLRIVEPAVPPGRTKLGSKKTFVLVAAFVGLLLAAILALVAEAFRRRIESVEELERISPVPTVGCLRHGRVTATTAALVGARDGVLVVEAGDGAASLTLALARVLADRGRRALVVDADPRARLTRTLRPDDLAAYREARRSAAGQEATVALGADGLVQLLPHPGGRTPDADISAAVPSGAPDEAVLVCAGPATAAPDAQGSGTAIVAVGQGRASAGDVTDAIRILEHQGWRVAGTVLVGYRRTGLLGRKRAGVARRSGGRSGPRARPLPDAADPRAV